MLLAGCETSTTHGMSAANLMDTIKPESVDARPYRYTERDKECLERAMFFESNRSSRDGMVAVGTVVMNRLKSGKHGDKICDVVGEKNQFAPGVMTRPMNSKAMPDVEEAAVSVLKGERNLKVKDAMHFHTAGLKFKYKNMHYVTVAGGNAFYEKRGRNWTPLPPDTVMVASAPPAVTMPAASAVARAAPSPAVETTAVAIATASRALAPIMVDGLSDGSQEPVMSFEATPQQADAIGALIVSQGRPMEPY